MKLYVSHTTFQYYGLLRTFTTQRVKRTSFGGRIQVSWNTSVYDHAIIHYMRVSHSESTNMSALIPKQIIPCLQIFKFQDTSNKASRSMVCPLINWPSYVDRSWRTIWELPALFTSRPRPHGASTSATHNALHTDARLRTEADLQVPFCHPLPFGLVGQRSEHVDPFQTCS